MSKVLQYFLRSPLPQWHSKPLYLTNAEITDPYLVIHQLFDQYKLPEFRFLLKEWLDAALKDDEVLPVNFVALYDMMLRMVEAASVLKQQHNITNKTVLESGSTAQQ